MSKFSGILSFFFFWFPLSGFGAELFLAPDHFEIENSGPAPAISLSTDSTGTTVSLVFVPAYDVGQEAVGFAMRAEARPAEIVRLSVDVEDITINQLPIVGTQLLGVENERHGSRLLIRARFGKDLAPPQLRRLFTTMRAYGTVKARIVCGPETPSSLCHLPVEAVALNPFQNEDGDAGKIARMKYSALAQYKTEILLRPTAQENRLQWLDQQVNYQLMVPGGNDKLTCRSGITEYQDWICRIILEQSARGLMSEALFQLATSVYPPKFTGIDYQSYVFDAQGRRVNWLKYGTPSAAPIQMNTDLERLLGSRANPSQTEAAYKEEARHYLSRIFDPLPYSDLDAMAQNLASIRSLSENTSLNYSLTTLAVVSWERKLTTETRLRCLRLVLFNGRGYPTELEVILKKKNASRMADLESYVEKYFPRFDEKERGNVVRVLSALRSLSGNASFTRLVVLSFFQDIEQKRLPPRSGDAAESEFEKILRSRRAPGMTPELYEAAVRRYVQTYFRKCSVPQEQIVHTLLAFDPDSLGIDGNDRKIWNDVLHTLEELGREPDSD